MPRSFDQTIINSKRQLKAANHFLEAKTSELSAALCVRDRKKIEKARENAIYAYEDYLDSFIENYLLITDNGR